MPRGGARPGSGRKPNSPNVKTREIAAKAIAEGITPLEVMLHNMRFWHENAEKIIGQLQAVVFDVEDPADRKQLLDALQKIAAFREKSEECAVDAAPYMHPRLAAITMAKPDDKDVRIVGGLPVDGDPTVLPPPKLD